MYIYMNKPPTPHNPPPPHSDPCKNGGICHNLKNSFECECISGYLGSTCSEYNTRPCKLDHTKNDCLNNGRCALDPVLGQSRAS